MPISRGGTGVGSFTAGSIPFIFNGVFSEDNSSLFWDNANKKLGIGTSTPSSTLEVLGNTKVSSLTSSSDSNINSLTIGRGGGSIPGNTAVGSGALAGNTTGVENNAFGQSSLQTNITGIRNVGIGTFALSNNSTGYGNVALGVRALDSNTVGGSNVAIGLYSAQYASDGTTILTAPDYGTYIGARVRGKNSSESHSIVIGADAISAGSYTAVIGNSFITDAYFGSVGGNANLHGKKLYLGSSSVPGCIVMGDSDGGGLSYLTVNNGELSVSAIPPSVCQ